jgi:hypothetical protein
MAFATYDAYLDALALNNFADFQTSAPAFGVARFGALPIIPAPATPTTSVALDKDSTRAINSAVPNAGAGRLSVLGARVNPSGVGGVGLMLVDLLNISGGLDATVTTAQTTNLPTAALTRYTNGADVQVALIIHAQIGTTITTVTVSYTNQAGTSGQTSTAVQIGGINFREAGTLIRIPLAAGDTGVRSVESVTLVASTATAGNFGVVLYRPLAMFAINDTDGANVIDCVSSGRMAGQFNEVLDAACLSIFCSAAAGSQVLIGAILLAEA